MIRLLADRIGTFLRDSGRIWLLAPIIPLIAILPEFAQHVAEIRMGMFDSPEAARALSNDPVRWTFGYVKLAGYGIAILATIRFWAARRQGLDWWSGKGIAWRVLAIGLGLNILVGIAGYAIEQAFAGAGELVVQGISVAWALATLPVLVLLVAGLVGDSNANLVAVYRNGWAAALRIVLFSAIALAPLMWLHSQNHHWAMGAPAAAVWAVMVFDSFLVGLLACSWGTAIHHGYRKLDEPVGEASPSSSAER